MVREKLFDNESKIVENLHLECSAFFAAMSAVTVSTKVLRTQQRYIYKENSELGVSVDLPSKRVFLLPKASHIPTSCKKCNAINMYCFSHSRQADIQT